MIKLMTPEATAEALGVEVQTLAVWRCTKRYSLAWVKLGKKVMYRHEDVERFILQHLHGMA